MYAVVNRIDGETSGKHSLLPRTVTLQWFSGKPDKFGGGMYRDSSCCVDDACLCSVRSLNTTGGVHRASACLVYGVSFSRVVGGSASVEVHRDSTRQVCDASVLAVAISVATAQAVHAASAAVAVTVVENITSSCRDRSVCAVVRGVLGQNVAVDFLSGRPRDSQRCGECPRSERGLSWSLQFVYGSSLSVASASCCAYSRVALSGRTCSQEARRSSVCRGCGASFSRDRGVGGGGAGA